MAGRLQGAKRAAAARGELRTPLPVGYLHDPDGQVVIDPDEEVAGAVADVFATFTATGSAYRVVAAFAGRRFPLRAYGGAWAGQLRWSQLNHARVLGVLNNPCYTGAYVFGRYASRRSVRPDGSIHSGITLLPMDQWQVLIRDHHPGYLSWEDYLANQAKIAANRTHTGPARPGKVTRCVRASSAAAAADGRCRPGITATAPAPTNATPAKISRGPRPAGRCPPSSRRARGRTAAGRADPRRGSTRVRRRRRGHPAPGPGRPAQPSWRSNAPATTPTGPSGLPRRGTGEPAGHPHPRGPLGDPAGRPGRGRSRPGGHPQHRPLLPARADLQALLGDLPRLWHADTTTARDRKRLLRT